MNYEKYLDLAGVTDPELRSRCLTYLAQCESQYSSAKIRRHKAVAWAVVVRRNVGVKLGLAVNGFRRRAPLVMIKFSLLRGKS